jgi:hypothetical protein
MSIRWIIGVVAAVAFVGGVIALSTPVNAEDNGGRGIPCGTGFWSDASEAHRMGRAENLSDVMLGGPSSDIEADYAGRCADAVTGRRLLAWPFAIAGLVGILVAIRIRFARPRGVPGPTG